jgi:hypothetical protein
VYIEIYKHVMSSSEFARVLVRDERLDCHPSIPFAVYKSGQNVTVATFRAISEDKSSHTYNIQVPSETTIIDRRVMWKSTVTFKVSLDISAGATNLPDGVPVLDFGNSAGFGPWPLHTLCTTQQITINNNTVSINMNDVIPAVGKLGIDRELQHYNQTALTETDLYWYQGRTALYNNAPLQGVDKIGQDRCYQPRGAVPQVNLSNPKLGTATLNGFLWNSVVETGQPTSGDKPNVQGGLWSCEVTVTFIEPLICSPWLYTNPYYNGQGFYGIQNLNFVFNINGNASSGFFRLAYPDSYFDNRTGTPVNGIKSCATEILKFTDSEMIFNFLSPKPSDMLTARNVVPYWEVPRFITGNFKGPTAATVSGGIITPTKTQIESQTLQLNQIPDKLIIFVRKSKSSRTAFDSDQALPISGISINFNNQSGILASATQDQLWRFSVESGSIQTWNEFKGVSSKNSNFGDSASEANTNYQTQVPMLGSYLMLEFGRHIQITEDYYASGSLGNFNLQFRLTVQNYTTDDYDAKAGQLELILITQNSGIFVTEKGQSATYTGVLTKDDVLSASASEAVNERALDRLVGGGPKLGKIMGLIDQGMPIAKRAAEAFLPEDSKLRKGISMAEDIRGAIRGNGRAGSRVRGAGKGSAKFSLEDRLV